MIRPHGNDLIDRSVDAARSDTIRQGFAELPQVTPDAPVAPYQRAQTDAQTQASILRDLELSAADHERLIATCEAVDITFLATPFDTAN